MKLTSIIVEDEETSREILKNYLKKYCPNVSILGEASNVEEALVLIRNNPFRFGVFRCRNALW